MANETTKDQRLIRYLLGQLPEAERTEIEDRYFADDALFEYLAAVETELMDAYARGELAAHDRAQFEKRFLESPRPRARVALARRLQERAIALVGAPVMAVTAASAGATGSAAAGTPRGDAPGAAGKRMTSPLAGAAAGVVILLTAGVVWWRLQPGAPGAAVAQNNPAPVAVVSVPLPTRAAEPPMTADRLLAPPVGPVSIVLAPRDSNGVLTRTQGDGFVRLEIDHDGAAREKYAVIVATKDHQRVWTELNMAPRAPGAAGVILQVPADSLPAGDYVLTLSGGRLQARRLDFVADYTLHVK